MPSPKLIRQAGLDDASRARRLAFLEIGPEDVAHLAEIGRLDDAEVARLVDDFYAHLLRFDETRALLGDAQQIAHLKDLQRAYFRRLTEGRLDADYFESRLRVGAAHARIDLKPEWYLGTYALYARLLLRILRERHPDEPERVLAFAESLWKVILLDMGLAIDAYIMSGYVDRALAQEYRRMAEVAERTLREKADLERMKADLTSMIVHDLKGPLGGILTVTQLALRKREPLSPVHARHFEQIQRSARDLMRMIENLLEIDQMQEGRLDLRVEAVEVAALVAECADEFRPTAELAGQTISMTMADDVPVIVTDRWLLRRVLNNLVVNAIRHSGTAGNIDLDVRFKDGRVQLEVRDAGRGIPLEDQRTLFLKEAGRGGREHRDDTGLGLVFCKMAVERMGGAIAVASAPGRGAAFTVSLPLTSES